MEFKVTIPIPSKKFVMVCGDSKMEIDLARFNFGDGKWVVNIQGADVFS